MTKLPLSSVFRSTTLFLGLAAAASSFAQQTDFFPSHYVNHAFHADEIVFTSEEKSTWSDAVVEGAVVEAHSQWNDHRLESIVTVAGRNGEMFPVRLDGGIMENENGAGSVGSFRTGEMYLNPGATGTFYLKASEDGHWKPAVGAQSFEPAERTSAKWMGLQRADIALSTDWAAGNASEFVTLMGIGFGETQGTGYVTFDNGGEYYASTTASTFNCIDWSDNSITVEVPQAFSNRVRVVTGSGEMMESNDSLHIGYNIDAAPGSAYGYTHLHNQADGGYTFHVNESIFNASEAMDAVVRTLDDFVCKTGVNFKLADSGTSLGWDLGDGQNTISYDSPENPLSPGTVGFCHTMWWSCILGDVTFYVVGEMDVVLNSSLDYDFSTGPVGAQQAKFAYVLMHELGHAMRLGHVNEWGESMYSSVTDLPSNQWSERDTISSNDRLGVTYAVELASTFTFNACGISNMVPLEVDCEPLLDIEGDTSSSGTTNQKPYPNPFTDQLWIPGDAETAAPSHVHITNALGQIVNEMTIFPEGAFWNAQGQPDGIYFIQIISKSGSKTPRRVIRVVKTPAH